MNALSFGSLFAGIGGFDLGLERAGMRSVWQCEIDGFCQRVLEKHWPDVLRVPDVRDVNADTVPRVDVIAGGFPCQPVSDAGLKLAQDDRRWMWPEFATVIRELRPRYVLVENVAALLARGLARVLADLADIGFDAEWTTLRASDFGAPHPRDRLWLVAYPTSRNGATRDLLGSREDRRPSLAVGGLSRIPMAPGWQPRGFWGATEPPSPLLVDGAPGLMDEIAAIGNSLVPQIAEWIGRRIIDYEEEGRLAA